MHCFVAIIARCCVYDIYLHRELLTHSMHVYALNHPKRCNRHDECESDYSVRFMNNVKVVRLVVMGIMVINRTKHYDLKHVFSINLVKKFRWKIHQSSFNTILRTGHLEWVVIKPCYHSVNTHIRMPRQDYIYMKYTDTDTDTHTHTHTHTYIYVCVYASIITNNNI